MLEIFFKNPYYVQSVEREWNHQVESPVEWKNDLFMNTCLLSFTITNRGGGASEQLRGRGEHAKHTPLGGSGGMLPQGNF